MDNGNAAMGLAVGLPLRTTDLHCQQWSFCFALINYPSNIHKYFLHCIGKPIDQARNEIAERALKCNVKYLWFLDSDVAVPDLVVKRLMYDLESADDDVMVAGGIYTTKAPMPEPLVYNGNGHGPFWKWKYGEVFECSGIGTGCMMIKTEVFKHLEKPWFKTIEVSRETNHSMTDDLYFCEKVTNAGFKIIADGNIICIHWDMGTSPPTPYTLASDSYPLQGFDVMKPIPVKL